MRLRETRAFRFGQIGERLVVRWIKAHGFLVIPSYDYSGEGGDKAPRLKGISSEYAIPDLDVALGGKRFWIEVKAKTEASWTHLTQRYEHGFSGRLYKDYLRVAEETGTPVLLFIVERKTSDLLTQNLAALGEPRMSAIYGQGMVYWPRDGFRVIHTFTEEEINAAEAEVAAGAGPVS